MEFKKTIISLALCGVLILGQATAAFADSSKVVTLGANLSEEQKNTMLDYFGVKKTEVVVLEVNNQEERKYLEGIASEQQIGTRTYSCAYVEPTSSGKGINVKTANITWVTSSMVATTLSTAGLTDANCVIASIFPVSGTGALTGIMKAFEDATGEKLDEEKKEIASEELIITGELGSDVGQDKATGVINEIKTEIIKNDTKDTIQIAETIVNVTNNYNITLSDAQQKQVEELMKKIADQDYNYKDMKTTLKNVKKNVEENLKAAGERVDSGMFESIGNWFEGIGDWFSNLFSDTSKELGILGSTDDSVLGENAKVDSTDKEAINVTESTESEGFFTKLWNWFTGLFDNSDSGNNQEVPNENKDNSTTGNENTNVEDNKDTSAGSNEVLNQDKDKQDENKTEGTNKNEENNSTIDEEKNNDASVDSTVNTGITPDLSTEENKEVKN